MISTIVIIVSYTIMLVCIVIITICSDLLARRYSAALVVSRFNNCFIITIGIVFIYNLLTRLLLLYIHSIIWGNIIVISTVIREVMFVVIMTVSIITIIVIIINIRKQAALMIRIDTIISSVPCYIKVTITCLIKLNIVAIIFITIIFIIDRCCNINKLLLFW